MKLTTDFRIYSNWSEKEKTREVECLVKTIRAFAAMPNSAFWDAKSIGESHCFVVYGFAGEMEDAVYIKSDDIEKEVRDWCNEVKDWCSASVDDRPDDEEFACKELRVEIMDSELSMGLYIKTYNEDDKLDYMLWILPPREKKGGAK